MSLDISPAMENRLAEEARKLGISVDALLQQLMKEHGAANGGVRDLLPELPAWRLGVKGTLHRRDIYDDAG
jgi:hypothetical protein